MNNETTKVMLEYTKVLLRIYGIKDATVDEALDEAISVFEKLTCHDLPQSNTFSA